MTSFLYEANRYREDHEYSNYWKWRRATEKRAEEAGIDTLELDKLITIIIKLREEKTRTGEEYTRLEEEYVRTGDMLKDHKTKLIELQKEIEKVQPHVTHIEQQLKIWQDATMDYGEHHDDCGWVELIQSGRVVDAQEKDYCTCGWYQKRMDLKKTHPRYRDSRPIEATVVKKKESKGSFKVDLDI